MTICISDSLELKYTLKKIMDRLEEIKGNRRQNMHSAAATIMSSKLELLKDLVNVYNKNRVNKTENRIEAVSYMEFILKCITKNEDRLTTQEINDIQNEIVRLNRMIQLFVITEAPMFRVALERKCSLNEMHENVKRIIFGILPFTKDVDEKVCMLQI